MDIPVNSYLQRQRAEEQANMMKTSTDNTDTRPGCTDGAGTFARVNQAHKIHCDGLFPLGNKYFGCESPKPDAGGPYASSLK
ncbi:hypothetical protein ACFX1Q_000801 [Malus domestica]